jgi:Tripartite tricarboxylate transporter TctB family
MQRDLIGGATWVVLGGAIVAESLRMDRFTAMGASLYTMPGLVPGLFGATLMLLGALLAWRAGRQRAASAALPDTPTSPRWFTARVAAMLAFTLTYAVLLVGRAPFAPATFVFMALFMSAFAPAQASWMRRAGVAVITSAITTATVVLVFERVFLVRLP